MKCNKFNAAWQLARVNAKGIKDVDEKIITVLRHFDSTYTKQDKCRVLNWLRMTKLAYKDQQIKDKFDFAIESMQMTSPDKDDNGSMLDDLNSRELETIYKDLKSRKYNFQFKKVPVAHTAFMQELEEAINAY